MEVTEKLRLYQNQKNRNTKSYPWFTAVLAVIAMLIAPFVSPYIMFVPFVIQLYRLIYYDTNTICIDIAFIIPFAFFYKEPNGTAFSAFYILIYDIAMLIRYFKFRINHSFWFLLISCVYFFFRLGSKVSSLVFIWGGLLFLYLTFCNRNIQKESRILYSFVLGVIVSSIYAYIFWNNAAVQSYISDESMIDDGRFRGLFADPNYYSVYLILALVSLMILKKRKKINSFFYYISIFIISFAGILTVSKSFILMMVLLFIYQLFSMYSEKKIWQATVMLMIIGVLLFFGSRGEITFLDTIVERFLQAETINDLTTGRANLWEAYIEYIWDSPQVMLIGAGLDALLLKRGTHNIYLESIYNTGIIGFCLLFSFLYFVLVEIKRQSISKCNLLGMRFLPIFVIATMYFFLQGMSLIFFYLALFIMYVCYSECIKNN